MNLRKKAITGIKWTSIGTVGRALFQLLQISILTRFLPQEAFGLVAMALFLVQFSNIFVDMGMTSAILHRQDATKKGYSSIYWLNIFMALFLYVLLYFCTPFAANFYNEPELNTLVPILGFNLVLLATGRQHRTIMQKQFKFSAIAKIELVSYLLGLVSAILFAVNDFGLYSLVYSTLIASFISNSLFLILNLRLNPISFQFNLQEIKPFFRIGGFTMGSSLLDFFSREVDVLIIGKMLGSESLGLYSLAKQIILKLYSIVNPIMLNVLSPILSSIQKDKEKMKSLYLRIINLLASINFPIYLLITIVSKEILIILYGQDYSSGYLVLSFLAISYAVNTISNPIGSLQIATGRTDLGFKWTVFRLIVTPISIFIAAKFSLNIVAATTALLSIFLTIPLWTIQIKPMIRISLNEYLDQFLKPLILMLLVSVFYIVGAQLYVLPLGLVINSLIKGSVAICSYFVLLWLFDSQRIKDVYYLILSRKKTSRLLEESK